MDLLPKVEGILYTASVALGITASFTVFCDAENEATLRMCEIASLEKCLRRDLYRIQPKSFRRFIIKNNKPRENELDLSD